MTKRILVVVSLMLIAAMALSACGGGEESNATITPRSQAFQDEATAEPVDDGNGEEVVDEGPQEVNGIPVDDRGVPLDVPIPEGAYNLGVSNKASNIEFELDGGLQPIADFYAEEMDALGWSPTNSPDTVVGAMGTLIRNNEAGDTWSLNMSYNQNGDYVTVYITVLRAK